MFPGMVICVAAAVYLLYQKGPNADSYPERPAETNGENTQPTQPSIEEHSNVKRPEPKEDPDIIAFARKIVASKLTESWVLSLLQSPLSQNKHAVVLETYNEQGGAYTDPRWGALLISLLLNSNEWPELANKSADSLAIVNKAGALNEQILREMQALSSDEIVKRSALSYALSGRDALESALTDASSDPELEILSRKHAALLDQDERLNYFNSSKSDVAKTKYLEKYISSSISKAELTQGLIKGIQDPSLKNVHKSNFVLAASESPVPGKSTVLFEYWKTLLPKAKEQADFIAMLNIAVQKAAYSELDKVYAENIIAWLNKQTGFDPNNTLDPRIDLSIAMVNACTDDYIKKNLCASLQLARKKLEDKLKKEGFTSYITGA
jgi:hypothetical protein